MGLLTKILSAREKKKHRAARSGAGLLKKLIIKNISINQATPDRKEDSAAATALLSQKIKAIPFGIEAPARLFSALTDSLSLRQSCLLLKSPCAKNLVLYSGRSVSHISENVNPEQIKSGLTEHTTAANLKDITDVVPLSVPTISRILGEGAQGRWHGFAALAAGNLLGLVLLANLTQLQIGVITAVLRDNIIKIQKIFQTRYQNLDKIDIILAKQNIQPDTRTRGQFLSVDFRKCLEDIDSSLSWINKGAFMNELFYITSNLLSTIGELYFPAGDKILISFNKKLIDAKILLHQIRIFLKDYYSEFFNTGLIAVQEETL